MPLNSFDNSCPWPRRLLHIQTLTSYEWQTGNTYNGHRNPKYNALSYTWGRWELDDDEMKDIKGIPVGGISWTIPRIDPSHFTAERFAAVIVDTASSYPSESDASSVEFLWLDVACIDQTQGLARKLWRLVARLEYSEVLLALSSGSLRVQILLLTAMRLRCCLYLKLCAAVSFALASTFANGLWM